MTVAVDFIGLLPVMFFLSAAAAGLASVSNAQVTQNSTVSFTLSFVDTGNNNGIVETGESALITMNVSFTGQNTVGSFAPPIGTFTSGTIRGLGAGFIDLNGTSNGGGNANGDDTGTGNGNGNSNANGGHGNGNNKDPKIGTLKVVNNSDQEIEVGVSEAPGQAAHCRAEL